MPSILQQGAEWLARMQNQFASKDVTYQRLTSSICIRAMPGRSVFEVTDSQGIMTKIETQDYIVMACDLLMDDLPTLPQAGDRIIDGCDIFEVMPVEPEPAYRFTDEHREQIRIHTKKVGEQP